MCFIQPTHMKGSDMTALEQINALSGHLPAWVLEDLRIRIGDWMTGGGGPDDPYIHQQLRFAKNVIRSGNNGGND